MRRRRSRRLWPAAVIGVAVLAGALAGCSEETPASEILDDRPEVARADLSGVEVDVHREPG